MWGIYGRLSRTMVFCVELGTAVASVDQSINQRRARIRRAVWGTQAAMGERFTTAE